MVIDLHPTVTDFLTRRRLASSRTNAQVIVFLNSLFMLALAWDEGVLVPVGESLDYQLGW